MSAIFFANEQQEKEAIASKKKIEKKQECYTQVFFPAEKYTFFFLDFVCLFKNNIFFWLVQRKRRFCCLSFFFFFIEGSHSLPFLAPKKASGVLFIY